MSYTNGPWKIEHDVIVSIKDKDGDWPVICKKDHHSIDKNWSKNAKLIAAAPDLLDALIMARSKLIALPDQRFDEIDRGIPLIDSAIKKATNI